MNGPPMSFDLVLAAIALFLGVSTAAALAALAYRTAPQQHVAADRAGEALES
jgi:hypothetical protein